MIQKLFVAIYAWFKSLPNDSTPDFNCEVRRSFMESGLSVIAGRIGTGRSSLRREITRHFREIPIGTLEFITETRKDYEISAYNGLYINQFLATMTVFNMGLIVKVLVDLWADKNLVDIVFIDFYIPSKNHYANVRNDMVELKELALKNNLHICVIVNIQRNKGDQKPVLSS